MLLSSLLSAVDTNPKDALPAASSALSPLEKQALERIRGGDLQGLKTLYDMHALNLLNQSWRILQNRAAAEDSVHDLFLKLPEALKGFRGESSLRTWLFRAMHNHCLNLLSIESNRRALLRRELPSEEPLSQEPMASTALENHDLLQRALDYLEPDTRSLLWLKEAEGLSLKELVAIFEEPEGTLKARLSRAREKLRFILAKEFDHG